MIAEFLIKKINNSNSEEKRKKLGYLSGYVGVSVNFILFLIKLIIGLISNSIAVLADAFNNLSDIGSSLITIIGFKIADKPADKEHPFGHGRGEYIAGLIVSIMVILVGFEFLRSSFDKIMHPQELNFSLTSFVIILFSITFKLWLGGFNKKLARLTSSNVLDATSFDSYSDVLITSTVAIGLFFSRYSKLPIDGYIGLLVSGFIIYAGYNLIKETISPLLGEAPDPEFVQEIVDELLTYEHIIGVHDVIVHSYGFGTHIVSIHAEVPANIDIMQLHEVIDRAENEISKKLNISLIIHMDPVNLNDTEIMQTKDEVIKILGEFPEVLSMHDFRIIGHNDHKSIIFDMVISYKILKTEESRIVKNIIKRINEVHPHYKVIIHVDRDYIQVH
ncbi:Ferrous-iron efflux pump FieF [Caloramator mitchellensis]|uniref:Ferrous-iron efflux pump FieF n=1 Tax=Caloramator mitchellensis TaxID=908809 RepID=A0A0R3JWJ3_CALMK|nr:cation diffusion facilitator family transporter [Caloramator mitchellensis]KRQ87907.1 Ferrous-iron efflux pump FieF [Caloramator mitchellensis]